MNEITLKKLYNIWVRDSNKATDIASQIDTIIVVDESITENRFRYNDYFLYWLFESYNGHSPTNDVKHIRDLFHSLQNTSLFNKSCISSFIPIDVVVELKMVIEWDEIIVNRDIPNDIIIDCRDHLKHNKKFINAITDVKCRDLELFAEFPVLFCKDTFIDNGDFSEQDFLTIAKLYSESQRRKKDMGANSYSDGFSYDWFIRKALGRDDIGSDFFETIRVEYSFEFSPLLQVAFSVKFGGELDFVSRNTMLFSPNHLFNSHSYNDSELERLIECWSSFNLSTILSMIFGTQDFSLEFFLKYVDYELDKGTHNEDSLHLAFVCNDRLSKKTLEEIENIFLFKGNF